MKRNKANLSHYRLLTGNFGKLMPIGCVEVLPGDTFQHSTSLMLRCSPMLAPVMHQVNIRVHHFYVPNRLSMEATNPGVSWEDLITHVEPGAGVPQITYDPTQTDGLELLDYFGVPIGRPEYDTGSSGVNCNALPIAAYNLIWNEFYRDQDLQATPRAANATTLADVSWQKDYFTAARPWAQKGGPVTLPLGTTADVFGLPATDLPSGTPFIDPFDDAPVGIISGGGSGATGALNYNASSPPLSPEDLILNTQDPIAYADLATATAVDVNDVRLAFALQRYEEARARYGSRYTEYLRYLGITPSDSRLQRPEYLGGGKTTISFSEVLQTAEGTDPVATMRGHGIAAMRSNRYRRFFEEHGYVISLLSVVPRNIYSDATPRHWLKENYLDYYQRELQDIGMQEIFKGEVFPTGVNDGLSREPWGYAPRYSEYMSQPSQISGQFKNVLNYWHMARIFDSAPVLNEAFIKCVTENRQFADTEGDPLYIFAHHQLGARRMVRKVNVGRII